MKNILFKPFEKFQESTLSAVGVLLLFLGSWSGSVFNARFDGLLDVHFVEYSKFQTVFLDNSINILVLSILLIGLGKWINPKTRIIDILNASLIGRIPFYFLALFNINEIIYSVSKEVIALASNPSLADSIETSTYAMLAVFAFISLMMLVWSIYLIYTGFKIATNSKRNMDIILFILVIVLGEILSKLIITQIS